MPGKRSVTVGAPAAGAKAKAAAPKKGLPEFVINPYDFGHTADWLLYTPSTYVRAKKLAEDSVVEGKEVKAGNYVVVSRDGDVTIFDGDQFEREFETVKGPHKQEY